MLLSRRSQAARESSDIPLNFNQDQKSNLNPELRRLNLKLGWQHALELVSHPPTTLLLGGTVGALLTRKYALASCIAAGLVLQQALAKGSSPNTRQKEKKALELERYALKAQRGDYGKLAVIPFK